MIHNMTEERKKVNRYDASRPTPLTDEELESLIGVVEERELLRAPGHLKGNVLMQIQAGKRRERQRALFSYRAKVLAGMAAALAVLFLVPVERAETVNSTQTGILGALYEEETQGVDEWEQEIIDRQRDIDKTWERYREGQERADARRQYFRKFSEKIRNHEDWED